MRVFTLTAGAFAFFFASFAYAQEPVVPSANGGVNGSTLGSAGGSAGAGGRPGPDATVGGVSGVGGVGGGADAAGSRSQAASIDPSRDAAQLSAQGDQRPSTAPGAGATDGSSGAVFSEDWWSRTRPIVELHGYFRTRAEVFHNFSLGRHDAPGASPYLWPQPLDQSYTDSTGQTHFAQLCGDGKPFANCYDKSQASANLRFRINPEFHISDNLRIMSQVDALDNIVLGSTPDSYATRPGGANAGYNGYAPLTSFSTTQGPPTSGINGIRNSIDVKRVWGEYLTPVGQLRFGRMPHQWGLGMVANAGDGIDSDYQSTIDRIMFVTGLKSIDLYFGGAWDFPGTGYTSGSAYDVYGGQPYNTSNLMNANQWAAFIARRTNPDLQRLALARGEVVLNGGLYTIYRTQNLDVRSGTNPTTADTTSTDNGLERRGAQMFMPDLWAQLLWRKFRLEAEFATVYGSIEQTPQNTDVSNPVKIRQFGFTSQAEYKAVEDKLRLGFGFGWASGDPWAESLAPGNGYPQELNNGRGPMSTFRFHQDYRVDLIFYRRILTRVEGTYYFRPSVDYDFLRTSNGQRFGGGGAIIWSRASEFMQTPGHKRDLGVEIDLQLYYQAKDGSLNDDPDKVGGLFAMLQYGAFFPLGGLGYLPGQQNTSILPDWSTSAAQTVRLFLGIVY